MRSSVTLRWHVVPGGETACPMRTLGGGDGSSLPLKVKAEILAQDVVVDHSMDMPSDG